MGLAVPYPGPKRRQLRLVMQAFFDDGESFRRGNLRLLAGFVASDDAWSAFSDEWRTLLAKHELPFLHTSDFLSAQGDHRTVALTPPERVAVVREFIGAVRKHVHCGIGVTIDAEAFADLMARVPKAAPPKAPRKPEDFCLLRVLAQAVARYEEHDAPRPMLLTFDDSTKDSMRFYESYQFVRRISPELRSKVIGIAFCDDKLVPAVQAADMLACIAGRHDGRDGGLPSGDPFLDLLEEPDPAYGQMYTVERWTREKLFGHPELAQYLAAHGVD